MDLKEIIKELSSKYNEKVRLVEELFKVSFEFDYSLEKSTEMICNYLKNGTLGGVAQ